MEPIQEKKQKLGQMVHTSIPNAWQVEAEQSPGSSQLYNKFVDA